MRKMRKYVSIMFVITLLITPRVVLRANNLTDVQAEKEELEQDLKDAKDILKELENSKDNIETYIEELDANLNQITSRIDKLEVQLGQKEEEIVATKEQLAKAQENEVKQYESMKKRIKFMYENGNSSYIELILEAESFSQLLQNTEYIVKIALYDREMLRQYQETKDAIANAEIVLAQEYLDIESLRSGVEAEKEIAEALVKAKETELERQTEQIEDTQELADSYVAEIQAQDDIIAQIQAEEARKKAEEEKRREEEAKRKEEEEKNNDGQNDQTNNPPTTGDVEDDKYQGGEFTWPCPSSKRVTSDYGERLSPTAGASSNHKGIDVGASYGADIVAAADGKVTYAGYSSGAGNYITVSHGSGLYTVYMHCSSLVATQGQMVTKGETIAKIGSTGVSTGNHLHFGVSLNGSYVSPWNYLGR